MFLTVGQEGHYLLDEKQEGHYLLEEGHKGHYILDWGGGGQEGNYFLTKGQSGCSTLQKLSARNCYRNITVIIKTLITITFRKKVINATST